MISRNPLRLFVAAVLLGLLPQARAQGVPPAGSSASDPYAAEVLRALQQRGGGQSQAPLEPTVRIENPPVYRSPEAPDVAERSAQRPADQMQGAQSALERLMSRRAGQRVRQFGYDVFGQGGVVIVRQSGALQDSYILGVGDEIAVTLRGQENASYRTRVDRDGRVTFPGLPPVAAAGRTFGAFRDDLEAAVGHAFAGTAATVSVGAVRQISVRVVGEVNSPGVYSVTGLSTAMDALSLAGGVRKTGSLRDIEIIRGDKSIRLDLYTLLTNHASGSDVTLTDGDRIVVPLQGASVAVVGQIKRPAIYELPPHRQAVGTQEILALAGGPEIRGRYRFSVLRTREDGRRELEQIDPGSGALVHDGDVVFVASTADVSLGRVQLMGATRLGGFYPLQNNGTLHDLLHSSDAFSPMVGAPLPYLLIGAVIRLDPETMLRTVVPFSPVDVVAGRSNMVLQSNDLVYIVDVAEMRYVVARAAINNEPALAHFLGVRSDRMADRTDNLPASAAMIGHLQTAPLNGTSGPYDPAEEANLRGQTSHDVTDQMQRQMNAAPPDAAMTGTLRPPQQESGSNQSEDAILNPGIIAPERDRLAPAGDNSIESGSNRLQPPEEPALRQHPGAARRLFVGLDDDARRLLVRTLGQYSVTVTGEVNDPGVFLATPGTTLDHLVEAAGGVTPKVDLKTFEVTSLTPEAASGTTRTVHKTYDLSIDQLSQVALRPMDSVRFNAIYTDRDAGDVSLFGQVKFPGTYEITRGEHLSAVLARAGGFTEAAYPTGAIFLRRSVAEQERGVLQREGDQLESQLVELLGSVSTRSQVSDSEIQYINQMVRRLREASGQGGRVAIQIDPKEVAAHPELDIALEPGDQLFVPRIPSSVIVAGEVMSPGGIQYRPGRSVSDYVSLAGGVTEIADDDHIFVIRPDGSAVQADSGWALPFDSTKLAPGSVIVVPRTLRHFTWDTLLENIVQVSSQLAVTAASISVIFR